MRQTYTDSPRYLPLMGLFVAFTFFLAACEDDPKPTPTPAPEPAAMEPEMQEPDDVPQPGQEPDTPPCPAGTAGCPCDTGNRCDDGLVCEADTCEEAQAGGFRVSDPNARSCEVLLQETTARITGIEFGAGVQGAMERRAPKVALSFLREADGGFETGSVTLQLEGPSDGYAVRNARCFNNQGEPIDGVEVIFE